MFHGYADIALVVYTVYMFIVYVVYMFIDAPCRYRKGNNWSLQCEAHMYCLAHFLRFTDQTNHQVCFQ